MDKEELRKELTEKYPGISPRPVYGVFGACGYLPNEILDKSIKECMESDTYKKYIEICEKEKHL